MPSIEDLEDPHFLAYVKKHAGFPVTPDDQDYDWLVAATKTEDERAHHYRLAQARKILRLYHAWKTELN